MRGFRCSAQSTLLSSHAIRTYPGIQELHSKLKNRTEMLSQPRISYPAKPPSTFNHYRHDLLTSSCDSVSTVVESLLETQDECSPHYTQQCSFTSTRHFFYSPTISNISTSLTLNMASFSPLALYIPSSSYYGTKSESRKHGSGRLPSTSSTKSFGKEPSFTE